MSRKSKSRDEAAFMRGDTGVDGLAVVEDVDDEQVEKDSAKEQLFRSRTWLGREFLTWLLWKSESTEALCEYDGQPVQVLFVDQVTLRGIQGEVSEMKLKGKQSPYSAECKFGLMQGLLLHSARLTFTAGERAWDATLDAENLDIRSGKIPQLLKEEEDDLLAERLDLTEQLSAMIDSLVETFLEVRIKPIWRKQVVPAMQEWMKGEDEKKQRFRKGA